MPKYKIVKRGERWYFSRPECIAGPHLCMMSLVAFFEPSPCGSRDTHAKAIAAVQERLKWEDWDRYFLTSWAIGIPGGPWPK